LKDSKQLPTDESALLATNPGKSMFYGGNEGKSDSDHSHDFDDSSEDGVRIKPPGNGRDIVDQRLGLSPASASTNMLAINSSARSRGSPSQRSDNKAGNLEEFE